MLVLNSTPGGNPNTKRGAVSKQPFRTRRLIGWQRQAVGPFDLNDLFCQTRPLAFAEIYDWTAQNLDTQLAGLAI